MGRSLTFATLSSALFVSACLDPRVHTAKQEAAGAVTENGVESPAESYSGKAIAYEWKNVEVLGGGYVPGIIFSKKEKSLVYARTDIGGAYRMDPKTGRWIPITDGFGRDDDHFKGIESLAIDPTDPNKLYMAVGTYTKDWAGAGAMVRSSDRGNTWQIVRMPIKMGGNEYGRSAGERLAVDPNQPQTLYFGSRNNGLQVSRDGSVTWGAADFPGKGDPDLGIINITFDEKSGKPGIPTPVIYAGLGTTKEPSLYVTKDAGKTWSPVAGGPEGMMPAHVEIGADGLLYLAYRNQPGPNDVTDGSIQKYDPKSGKWTDISPLKPTESDKFGYGGLSLDAQKPGTLIVTTIDRWTHKDEIFYSKDSGKSWMKVGSSAKWDAAGATYVYFGRETLGVPHWMGDIDIDPFDSNRAIFVTGAGVWASLDLEKATSGEDTPQESAAVSWRFENRGLEETAIATLSSPPKGPPLLSGMLDICGFRHDDLEKAPPQGFFKDPQCNGSTGLDFAEDKPEVVVRVGRVWGEEPHGAYSTDAGNTWKAFPSEPKTAPTGGVITITPDAKALVWATKGATPVRSTDMGKTWKEVSGLREGIKLADWASFDLIPAADRVNSKIVYVYDAHKGHVYVSRDAGASYERTKTGLPELQEYELLVADIEAVPGKEGHVWLSTGKEVYRSTDAGKSFSRLGNVEQSYGIGTGKAPPGKSYPTVYLSAQIKGVKGFFRSDDEGKNWIRINDAAHQFGGVNVIEGDPRVFGRVYLGTHGRGIIVGEPSK